MPEDNPISPRSPTSGSFSQHNATNLASTTVGSPKLPKHPVGPRSQSQDLALSSPAKGDPRDGPGSSRTKYTALPRRSKSPEQLPQPTSDVPDLEPSSTNDAFPAYRSPEPVLDTPGESGGYSPRIVEEYDEDVMKTPPTTAQKGGEFAFDIETWKANTLSGHDTNDFPGIQDEPMDLEPDRPQIGPGMTRRAVINRIHEHPLSRPTKFIIPPKIGRASQKTSTSPVQVTNQLKSPGQTYARPSSVTPMSPTGTGPATTPLVAQTTGTIDFAHVRTARDVESSLPGGVDGRRNWYFCPQCCAWYKVTTGESIIEDGKIQGSSLDWDAGFAGHTEAQQAFNVIRGKGLLRDIHEARSAGSSADRHTHFHELRSSLLEPSERPLERVDMGEELNQFPHRILGVEADVDPAWTTYPPPGDRARLFLDCTSEESISVEMGPIAGQIPKKLMGEFVREKSQNPNVGVDSIDSFCQGLQMLITLLAGPLFKGQRGWVKLDNPKFRSRLSTTFISSTMLYMIGFGCKEGAEGREVGPLSATKDTTEEQIEQQDRYMMRTWVELCMTLRWFENTERRDLGPHYLPPIEIEPLSVEVDPTFISDATPLQIEDASSMADLGVSSFDDIISISRAYTSQIGCDAQNAPKYLGALESISKLNLKGGDELEYLLVTERSLNKYTEDELEEAYDKIGFSARYAKEIDVEADDAPDSEILRMHQIAMQSCTNSSDRAEISQAVQLLGRHRKNAEMQRLGRSGAAIPSVVEAYEALNAPHDAVDDGLVLQYEMAVNEYPGKVEHYRACLEVIATRPGFERPGLQRYLESGSMEEVVVKRNDIPAGLQNIGNTCYLNSILQYLYSIKPLREAVLNFSQDTTPVKPEVERSKRFVHQLRRLFLQLYKTEASAVRPDEELAYLAITRPEIDDIVQPEEPEKSTILDDMPTLASPSSTKVNTPEPSRPSSPMMRQASPSRSSVLGKRESQSRSPYASPGDRPRRSDGFIKLQEADAEADSDFQMIDVDEKSQPIHQEFADPPSSDDKPSSTAGMDMESLHLKSPDVEASEPIPPVYQPPPGPPPLPPRPRRDSKGTLNAGLKFGLQQDSAEVLINVLSQLEVAFEPPSNEDGSKGYNLIGDLFSCEYRQQIIYQNAEGLFDAQTPKTSVFVHPIISVEEEGKDLYDCLAELYLGGADIEYEGKKGHMMDLMDRFPPMLYIQMRRSQYDPATGRERKTNTHIPFSQTLTMDRFLADADPARRKRSIDITRQMVQLRAKVHALSNQKPLSVPLTFGHLQDSLRSLRNDHPELDISDDMLAALNDHKEEVLKEIERTKAKAETLRRDLDDLWADAHACEYDLVSVFMHRGKTSGAGHYWTYQAHLPDHTERFFKYNDELVTEVPASEVLQDRTGGDANPALLCYVRRGKDLVDTLHREVYELEQAGALDEIQSGTAGDGDMDEAPVKGSESEMLVDTSTTESPAAGTQTTIDPSLLHRTPFEAPSMIEEDPDSRGKSAPVDLLD